MRNDRQHTDTIVALMILSIVCVITTYLIFVEWKRYRITGEFAGLLVNVYSRELYFCGVGLLVLVFWGALVAFLIDRSLERLGKMNSSAMKSLSTNDGSWMGSLAIFLVIILVSTVPFWVALEIVFGLVVGPVQYKPFDFGNLMLTLAGLGIGVFILYLVKVTASRLTRK